MEEETTVKIERISSAGVSDIMFQAVKKGRLTYGELAHALGTCVLVHIFMN